VTLSDSPSPDLHARFARADGDLPVLQVAGEVDVATAPALAEHLDALLAGGDARVVVETGGMTFIDSSGLGALVTALRRARASGQEIEIRGLQPSPRRVFEITGLHEVFVLAD